MPFLTGSTMPKWRRIHAEGEGGSEIPVFVNLICADTGTGTVLTWGPLRPNWRVPPCLAYFLGLKVKRYRNWKDSYKIFTGRRKEALRQSVLWRLSRNFYFWYFAISKFLVLGLFIFCCLLLFNFFTWSIWARHVNDQIVREGAETAHPKSATERPHVKERKVV